MIPTYLFIQQIYYPNCNFLFQLKMFPWYCMLYKTIDRKLVLNIQGSLGVDNIAVNITSGNAAFGEGEISRVRSCFQSCWPGVYNLAFNVPVYQFDH